MFFTAAPLRNSQGEVVGALETLQDVSERRKAEQALRESEERYRCLSQTDSLTGLYNPAIYANVCPESWSGQHAMAGRCRCW